MVKLFSKPPVGLYDDYVQLCHAMYYSNDAKFKISLDFLVAMAITLVEYNATPSEDIPALHDLLMKGVLMFDESIEPAPEPRVLLQRMLTYWTPSDVFITQLYERVRKEVAKDVDQRGIGLIDGGLIYQDEDTVDLSSFKISQFIAKLMQVGVGQVTKLLFPLLTGLESKDLKNTEMVTLEGFRTTLNAKLNSDVGHTIKQKLIGLWCVIDTNSINSRIMESIFIFISIISKSGNISDTWWTKRSAALSSSIGQTVQIDSNTLAQGIKFFNSHLRRLAQPKLVNMLFGSYHLIRESESAQSLLWIIEQSKGSNLGAISAVADANGKYAMFSYSTLSRIAGEELPRVCKLLQQMILDPYCAMLSNPIPVRTYANIAYIACKLIYKSTVAASDLTLKVTGYVNTLHTMITIDQGLLDSDVGNIRESQLQISGDRASLVKVIAKRYGYHISSDKNTIFEKIGHDTSTAASASPQYDMLPIKTHDMMINDKKYREVDIGEKYKEMMTKEDIAFSKLCHQFKDTMMQKLIPNGASYKPGAKLTLTEAEHGYLNLDRYNEEPVEYKGTQHTIQDNIRRSGSVLTVDVVDIAHGVGLNWFTAPQPRGTPPSNPQLPRPANMEPSDDDQ